MWDPPIVGFGRYRYRYDSVSEGDFMLTGFSPRKSNLVLYVLPGIGVDLAVLGKHKVATSCLDINKLADVDVDVDVLAKIVTDAVARVRRDYETFDR